MTAREQKKAAALFAANDAAVLAAYGFDPKAKECEIVSRLFEMYEKLTAQEK